MKKINHKILNFQSSLKKIKNKIKVSINFNPFYYLLPNQKFLFQSLLNQEKNLIFDDNINFNKKKHKLTTDWILKQEIFIKEFFINELNLLKEKNVNNFLKINDFGLSSFDFELLIFTMEFGNFISFLVFLKKNIEFNSIFSIKNINYLKNIFMNNYNLIHFHYFLDKWDGFFEFLILLKSYRNGLVHPSSYDFSLLFAIEDYIKFLIKLKRLKAKSDIIIEKESFSTPLKILFQNIDFLEIISNFFVFLEENF